MKLAGYYRFPGINGDQVVFTCEDDLWTVSADGGDARRLTSGLGTASFPAISQDGKWIAFVGREEGSSEVYLMPALGGPAKRLTYLGANTRVIGWRNETTIIFASDCGLPFNRVPRLFTLSIEGGAPTELAFGLATSVSFGPNKGCVLGRYSLDPARWKRYRGGTAGDILIDRDGSGNFRKLIQPPGNVVFPMWIGEKIYFLSDHEGIGNIYSCGLSGDDLKRHTSHEDFYVRFPKTDGKRITYQAGGDIFIFDPDREKVGKLAINYFSPRTQLNRKFVDSSRYLYDFDLHPQSHILAINTRGKIFTFGNWAGPVSQPGEADGVHYRLTRWLNDGKRLITVTDEPGEDTLEIHHADGAKKPELLSNISIGRPNEMKISPKEDLAAISNHRNELIIVDLKKKSARKIDSNNFSYIKGFDWSPDGKWIAYGQPVTRHTSVIKIADAKTGKSFEATRAVLQDVAPNFDPEGKYLYFISVREFDPTYDEMHFDLGFPRGMKPYLIPLAKDTPSPFVLVPKPAENPAKTDAKADAKGKNAKKETPIQVKIDVDGIQDRIVAFPVPDGRYSQIAGIKGKVLFTSLPVEGTLNQNWFSDEPSAKAKLEVYDFETLKSEVHLSGISYFQLSYDKKSIIYRVGNRLRIIKAGDKPDENAAKEPPSKKSGWIDLSRVKVSVNPSAEWKQILGEAWRLQRDHFWTEDMSKIDWEKVFKRYSPLIDRIATRGEFSDLIWEMQGELGTSHCYEMGGDYRPEPHYGMGSLGADFAWNPKAKAWKIAKIAKGDPWDESKTSPFFRPGVNVHEGDILLAVSGQNLDEKKVPGMMLINKTCCEVSLKVADADGKNVRTVNVKTLANETAARYRDWVEGNRSFVHDATKGKVGYVHIPNMGPLGYSEFHRYFLSEIDRDGLIVDVRFNGGGHVSQLILEKLARRRIAYVQSRWFGAESYPVDSVAGPMVALTNEWAGSDGDIFSHCFKLMKLGPLIGKRTWGGVVGICGRNAFVDGTFCSQPEFSYWFKDVGWKVENYGTDPDIEVEFLPQDYAKGRDPQLERSVKEITDMFKYHPPFYPDLTKARPSLALPKLPKAKKE